MSGQHSHHVPQGYVQLAGSERRHLPGARRTGHADPEEWTDQKKPRRWQLVRGPFVLGRLIRNSGVPNTAQRSPDRFQARGDPPPGPALSCKQNGAKLRPPIKSRGVTEKNDSEYQVVKHSVRAGSSAVSVWRRDAHAYRSLRLHKERTLSSREGLGAKTHRRLTHSGYIRDS